MRFIYSHNLIYLFSCYFIGLLLFVQSLIYLFDLLLFFLTRLNLMDFGECMAILHRTTDWNHSMRSDFTLGGWHIYSSMHSYFRLMNFYSDKMNSFEMERCVRSLFRKRTNLVVVVVSSFAAVVLYSILNYNLLEHLFDKEIKEERRSYDLKK